MPIEEIAFGNLMAPDASDYDPDHAELIEGLIPGGGAFRYELVPAWRNLGGQIIGGTLNKIASRALEQIFFSTSVPKLFAWVPSETDNTFVDLTPVPAPVYTGNYDWFRFGNAFIASPREDNGGQCYKYAVDLNTVVPVDPRFVTFQTSPEKPTGKFIGRMGAHLMLANIWETTAGRVQNRIWHSAKGNISDWTPSQTTRAGWFEINGEPEGNRIIAFSTWAERGVVMTQSAVYRLSLVGGNTIFDLEHIGHEGETLLRHPDGLDFDGYGLPVKVGRNLYYIANDGPRRVVNAEYSEPLGVGVVGRFILNEFAANSPTTPIAFADFDPISGIVFWVTNDSPVAADQRILCYKPTEDTWATVSVAGVGGVAIKTYASFRDHARATDYPRAYNALWPLVPIGIMAPAHVLLVSGGLFAGSNTRSTLAWKILSPIKTFGSPVLLRRILPLYRFDPKTSTDPVITITVTYGFDPRLRDGKTVVLTTANKDRDGFLKAGLPVRGTFWTFEISGPAMTLAAGISEADIPRINEVRGVVVDVDGSGRVA